jgi:hypothetical protein
MCQPATTNVAAISRRVYQVMLSPTARFRQLFQSSVTRFGETLERRQRSLHRSELLVIDDSKHRHEGHAHGIEPAL